MKKVVALPENYKNLSKAEKFEAIRNILGPAVEEVVKDGQKKKKN